jgi:hypothetical protein
MCGSLLDGGSWLLVRDGGSLFGRGVRLPPMSASVASMEGDATHDVDR